MTKRKEPLPERVCKYCPEKFTPRNSRQVMCLREECARLDANERGRRYFERHAEKKRERDRDRVRRLRQKHPDKNREACRLYYERNRGKVLAQMSRWRKENPEAVAEKCRRNYEKNREKILERNRGFRARNRERLLEYIRQWRDSKRQAAWVLAWKVTQTQIMSLYQEVTREQQHGDGSVRPQESAHPGGTRSDAHRTTRRVVQRDQ